MNKYLALFLFLFFGATTYSQTSDPVLFSVNGNPVHVSEFNYIYSKTNANKADFSKASLEEYLDLYTKFKLKVERAYEMKLDTIPSLQKELEGYRRQLADSYLIDREVTDKLVEEAYERTKYDVDISHIMTVATRDTDPKDTLIAYQKIQEARKRLLKGENFGTVADEISEDKSVTTNHGHVGFVTALFPNGFYELENAAYTLKPGEISTIIKTGMGFHLVKVNAKRDARGEIEAGHILIRVGDKSDQADKKAKSLADSLYNLLANGANFEDLAAQFSEDNTTKDKGGYLGFFGINRYEKNFEDAAFSIDQNGGYSKPVRSTVGWHILKRIDRRGIPPLSVVKSSLQSKINTDFRFERAQWAMIEKIKLQNNFRDDHEALDNFVETLDTTFLTFRWKPGNIRSDRPLFFLNNEPPYTVAQFEDYLSKSTRQRVRLAGVASNHDAIHDLFIAWVDNEVKAFEEKNLEEKYPDFKSLMREYREGILLFEATKMEVWDKAAQDSVGLKEFFKTVDGKYTWDRRAQISVYSLKEEAKDQMEAVKSFAAKNPPEKVLAKFNDGENTVLTVLDRTFEKGRNKILDQMLWEIGSLSPNETNNRDNSITFFKIEKILPEGKKTLEEARGYVVADYQDYLEKEWVKNLKEKYEVKVDQSVFNSLIKK